ncbi:MAG: metal ABC transporter substrate-binding protein [Acidimicrobiales bacterium]
MGLCLVLVAWVAGCSTGGRSTPSAGRRIQDQPVAPVAAGEPSRSERVLDVVATTSVAADWLRVVGNTNVRAHVLVKAGLDPVSYLATSLDVEAVRRADLIVAVGRGLEPWLDPVRQAAGPPRPILTLSEGLPTRATASGVPDPFLWLDLANAKQMVAALTTALAAADPADEAAFRFAADAYATELDRGDAEVRRLLDPVAGRPLVTAKETFGWLAARYGLDIIGAVVPSLDGRADIPPQHLAALRRSIGSRQVKSVFAEASVPDASVRMLAQDAGVNAVVGSDGLLGDGLGQAGTETDTFLGAVRHNARSLAANL